MEWSPMHRSWQLDVLQFRWTQAHNPLLDLVAQLLKYRVGMQMPPAGAKGSRNRATDDSEATLYACSTGGSTGRTTVILNVDGGTDGCTGKRAIYTRVYPPGLTFSKQDAPRFNVPPPSRSTKCCEVLTRCGERIPAPPEKLRRAGGEFNP